MHIEIQYNWQLMRESMYFLNIFSLIIIETFSYIILLIREAKNICIVDFWVWIWISFLNIASSSQSCNGNATRVCRGAGWLQTSSADWWNCRFIAYDKQAVHLDNGKAGLLYNLYMYMFNFNWYNLRSD